MRTLSGKRALIIAAALLAVASLLGAFVFFKDQPSDVPPVAETIERAPQEQVIGSSVEGRAIKAYTYGSGGAHLLFVGGIHGGYEWNSVLLSYRFMDYLEANPTAVPEDLSITVIPSANPDGLFTVVGKEGRFTPADVSKDANILASGRFNANDVDLNRNFGCKWKPESMWRGSVVSAGSGVFSEPEAKAIRDFVLEHHPEAAIFWHSQANSVYASECHDGILPQTLEIMQAYAGSSGYTPVKTFDAYEITGDVEGWLASINIPAITVELQTHETVEWERNLAGINALLGYYSELP